MASSRINSLEVVDDVDSASINSYDMEAARSNEESQTGLRPRRLGRLKVRRTTSL